MCCFGSFDQRFFYFHFSISTVFINLSLFEILADLRQKTNYVECNWTIVLDFKCRIFEPNVIEILLVLNTLSFILLKLSFSPILRIYLVHLNRDTLVSVMRSGIHISERGLNYTLFSLHFLNKILHISDDFFKKY